MQSIGGNLLQDLDKHHANHNGKGERSISTTLLRARSEDGTQPLFQIINSCRCSEEKRGLVMFIFSTWTVVEYIMD